VNRQVVDAFVRHLTSKTFRPKSLNRHRRFGESVMSRNARDKLANDAPSNLPSSDAIPTKGIRTTAQLDVILSNANAVNHRRLVLAVTHIYP
jgi:hypothetical protein